MSISLLILGLLVALVAVSGKDLRLNLLAPPAEVEYGFCDGSTEPFTFDVMSVEPFPILVQNGAMLSIAIQITLNEEVPVGTQVALNMVLEEIIHATINLKSGEEELLGNWISSFLEISCEQETASVCKIIGILITRVRSQIEADRKNGGPGSWEVVTALRHWRSTNFWGTTASSLLS